MNLNSAIKIALEVSGTPARTVATEMGLSPQNFGQRLRRDGFNLEETSAICNACGAALSVTLSYGGRTYLIKC